MSASLSLGFVPLCDAAGLIVAKAMGFFEREGLKVELVREASWATIRDKVAVGALDGAQMLAPMVLAQSLGLGGDPVEMLAPLGLGSGGSAVTVSARLGLGGDAGARGLAALAARRREMGASPLTFAVVFPYSTHNYLLRLWMASAGIDPDRDVRITVAAPSKMAALLADGVIEGFCAGEPWNAVAEAAGVGEVAVRAGQILEGAPDKVLGLTKSWAAGHPEELQALLRAVLNGLAWAEAPENRRALAALLAQPEYLDAAPQAVARGLAGIAFRRASRPSPEQGAWLLAQMQRWGQAGGDASKAAAEAVFRAELHDQAVEAA